MTRPTPSRDVFLGVTGARDNVGDTVLRRVLLDALRPHGTLHLWVGSLPETYLSGLGLDTADVLYRDRRRWRLTALRRAVAGRVVLAFHGGEISVTPAVLRSYLLHLPLLALIRLRGGASVHTSIGVRAPRRRPARILRSILTLCDLVTWRDQESRAWIGLGSVSPDWAFGHRGAVGAVSDTGRPWLAVALRHDRPAPTTEYVRAVCGLAQAQGLNVVLTAQTAADRATAREWAPLFGAHVVEWPGDDLAAAERTLRDLYSHSQAVVSNRLHGLIMAATEGAVPIGLGTSDVEKLDRGMQAAGLGSVAMQVKDASSSQAFADGILRRSEDVYRGVQDAAAEVDALARRMGEIMERVS